MNASLKATSNAEIQAKKATELRPFLSINLENIKQKVESILAHIGRNEIFSEYTKHDISHINTMLNSLDWLIPDTTKERLTSAEWLLIVLSIYFHDLGMLVTKEEYESRSDNINFSKYLKEVEASSYGKNYLKKASSLTNSGESFLYQEFVRKHHAERIKNWIVEKRFQDVGASTVVIDELKKMLGEIDNVFKKDLAMICESHHLNDLDDFNKYKVNQFYGSNLQERANLQYCAVILRTADLIHITSDRTPSIEYRLINPNDPTSQIEWAKQMAVRNVCPQDKTNVDGIVDKSQQPEVIEIIAYFDNATKATSFFGLMDYIRYAKKELERSHKWISESNKQNGLNYEFPWKNIDDNRIETEGFERKLFTFELDQQKILNLLVGHTLYNDPTVVIRELVQNSVDAIKLFAYTKSKSPKDGLITIEWLEEDRQLLFTDNGIGMTQEIIEKYLLKVGSSRYQDEAFKEQHPGFSAISRFGIGLLTCFLISDDIDITTVSESEETAKIISIRKVDGKYLMQHIDKVEVKDIGEHGTRISLKVRQDVELKDLEESLRKWILFPACQIKFKVGDKTSEIGYSSPKDALEVQLKKSGYDLAGGLYKVATFDRDGVSLAVALQYSPFLDQWTFLSVNHAEDQLKGTAIEGIRVEFESPGYLDGGILAAANCTGENAPKTNVARSHFEVNSFYTRYLKLVYMFYAEHIISEIERMIQSGISLTKAISESYFIMSTLTRTNNSNQKSTPIDNTLLIKELLQIPSIAIERNGRRERYTGQQIIDMDEFWIVESPKYRKAESFLEEVPGEVSAAELLKFISKDDQESESTIFCNYKDTHFVHREIFRARSLAAINVDVVNRRVDLKWIKNDPKLWVEIDLKPDARRSHVSERYFLQIADIELGKVPANTEFIMSQGFNIVLKGGILHEVIATLRQKENELKTLQELTYYPIVFERFFAILNSAINVKYKVENIDNFIKRMMRDVFGSSEELLDIFYEFIDREKMAIIMTTISDKTINFSRMYRSRYSYYNEY